MSSIQGKDQKNPDQNNIGILELFGKETLEKIQNDISRVTGLAVITSDFKGSPLTEMTAFTPFCQCIRKKSEQFLICNLSDAFGIAQSAVSQKACIYRCPCGLMEVAIPIIINGQFLGGFLAGQIRCPDVPDHIRSFDSLIQNISLNEHEQELYQQIPEMEYSKFNDIAELIFYIINLLGEKTMGQLRSKNETSLENSALKTQVFKLEYKNALLQQELERLKMYSHPYLFRHLTTNISNLAIMEDAYETNNMLLLYQEFMDYIYESQSEIISLNTELEILDYYFRLFSFSKKDAIAVQYNIKKEYMYQRIPAFILIHLLEEVMFPFSDGVYKTLNIDISAWSKEDYFHLEIRSRFELSGKKAISEASGREEGKTYIKNSMDHTRKMLRFFFENNYELSHNKFSDVESKITLKYPMYFKEYSS